MNNIKNQVKDLHSNLIIDDYITSYNLARKCDVVFAEELIIDLKTFPRPTMTTTRLKGEIIIDGVKSNDIELESWRNNIGYVSQDTVIFNDSIANNICMWDGDYNKDNNLFMGEASPLKSIWVGNKTIYTCN